MIRSLTAALVAFALTTGCTNAKESSSVTDPFETYLPWDASADNIQTTETGLQYIVLKEGKEGGKTPTADDTVRVNYDGRVPSGAKFDSSYDRGQPSMFQVNRVIPGWTMGLQLMSEGDEYLFYIPNVLAYGNGDRGDVIKAGDDLIFRVELIEVVEPKTADAAAWEKYAQWNSDAPEVVKTGSGLEYVVLASGDPAGPSPENGEMVAVHYEGRLAETGETFDSSFARNNPEVFPSNALIPGWVEGLAIMKPGDRWMMYIPSDLAYGEAGTPGGPIPANAPLMFEVEMLDVMKRG